MHKCFGPCSGSCFQVQIYCSTILLPNTFTFISPDARNFTLQKDDTVQRQQFLLPLPLCTNLNHHHFLLLTKVRNIVSMTNTSLMTSAWISSYETFHHLEISIEFETQFHPGWKKHHGCYPSRVSTSLVLKVLHEFFLFSQSTNHQHFQSYPLHHHL